MTSEWGRNASGSHFVFYTFPLITGRDEALRESNKIYSVTIKDSFDTTNEKEQLMRDSNQKQQIQIFN
ncbi:hypothetical protein QJS10_CPB11g02173 [Acorus calamus]|uniref:Uncharacterized protein n=1 Tax=Acorus calamus TaxID=4465 RepID=A0AAV9DU87_ACOCL|nr:hypothetical protein QJS10_CPB11g02173 [Acorus calamus]